MEKELVVFSGNSNRELSEKIAKELGLSLGNADVSKFANGEVKLVIHESVRGKDVFIVQSTCPPTDSNLMELLIFIDAVKRASAGRVAAVIPWYGYSRQDRKVYPREPITAKLVANLITAAGADRVLAVDLHSGQIQGFFDIPVDNLTAQGLFIEYVKEKNISDLCVVAPDAGAAKFSTKIAGKLNAELAIVNKERPKPNQAVALNVIGEVKGKNCAMFDDMIDTGGTLIAAAGLLKKEGAKQVLAFSTHGLFSKNAIDALEKSELDEIIITDSMPVKNRLSGNYKNAVYDTSEFSPKQPIKNEENSVCLNKKSPKIKVLSIAPLLAKAIKKIHTNESVSELFE